MPRFSLTACVQRCAIPFSFHSRELTKRYPCTTTAHEAQTAQTVNQLPFGAIREDFKGLAASYTAVGNRVAQFSGPVPSLDGVVSSLAKKASPRLPCLPFSLRYAVQRLYAMVALLDRNLYRNVLPVRGIQIEGSIVRVRHAVWSTL